MTPTRLFVLALLVAAIILFVVAAIGFISTPNDPNTDLGLVAVGLACLAGAGVPALLR